MNKISKRLLLLGVIGMLILLAIPINAFANAAEPPSLIILVKNPPADLKIVLLSDEMRPEANVRTVAWEGYYSFYSRDLQKGGSFIFKITTGDESFEWSPDVPLAGYNNVFTLDLAERRITSGKYPFRAAMLVALRLLLTLLLEAVIFMLFKFKEKRSWIVFLVINVLTQGALNIWLNIEGSLMPAYLLIALVVGEVLVFAIEMVAFPLLIREHKTGRVFLYVFIANVVSFLAGGYAIMFLPV